MSAYFVTLLVFGIVLTYLWLIHRFWLRDVFREDHKPAVRTRIAYYPALTKAEPRLVLVHPSSVILPELNQSLGRYAQKKLVSRKVEVRTDTRVTAFSDCGVELNNGETLATQTLVWTAGVKPPEVLQSLSVKMEKGRIRVNEMLEVPGFPGV